MSRPPPPTYKTRNWPSYNKALKRRGSLTIWFDPAMTWEAVPTGKRGRQPDYSDAAIQTCLTMKVLFGMALRQTTGFVERRLRMIGLDWAVPDFSTLSRRQKTLKVNIPYRGSDGPLHQLVDSTGIKVEGEGEWNLRRRPWRVVIGSIVIVFGIAMLLDALLALTSNFSWALRNGGIGCVVFAVGYFLFKSGWERRWFRHNS